MGRHPGGGQMSLPNALHVRLSADAPVVPSLLIGRLYESVDITHERVHTLERTNNPPKENDEHQHHRRDDRHRVRRPPAHPGRRRRPPPSCWSAPSAPATAAPAPKPKKIVTRLKATHRHASPTGLTGRGPGPPAPARSALTETLRARGMENLKDLRGAPRGPAGHVPRTGHAFKVPIVA